MANEDIMTALKNAVDRGESLESAIQVLISSGYDPSEVKESSNFFSGFLSSVHQEAGLLMPEQKKMFIPNSPKIPVPSSGQSPPKQQMPIYTPKPLPQQRIIFQQIRKEISPSISQIKPPQSTNPSQEGQISLSKQLSAISQRKQGYSKEIILVLILLLLIGVLVSTILFRDSILSWLSS